MPIIEVPGHGQVEFPDDMSDEQIVAAIKKNSLNYDRSAFDKGPIKLGKDAMPDTLRDVLNNTDWITRNVAGAGTAVTNAWEGLKQFVGKGDQAAIENNKIIEEAAPVGSFAGNVALTALPFGVAGQGVKSAVGVGAGLGALQPVSGEQSLENITKGKALNTVVGGVLGGAGQAVANKTGAYVSNKAAELSARKSARAPINQTIKNALDAGYVIPPGQVNPTFTNRVMESLGGKIATQQMASSNNQAVTDRLARQAAGLAPDAPIMPSTLKAVRDSLGKAYDDVGAVVGADTVEALKVARANANDLWAMQARNPHPETLAQARQATADAQNIEQTIDQVLTSVGKKDVMDNFREARRKIAINHSVENALVEGGGTVDAKSIARLAQRGDPLSGELRTIGDFANNFPKVVQTDRAMGTPDAHNLKAVTSLLAGSSGAAALGPAGVVLGAAPLVAGPVSRSIMFSRPVQRGLLGSYEVSPSTRIAGGLLKHAPVGFTALGLEALR